MTGKEMMKLLQQNGFRVIRVHGSHHVMGNGALKVSVPVHGKQELGTGLEHKLLKEAGLR